jgi:putative membrane protein
MEPAGPSKSSPKVVETNAANRPPQAHLSEHLANERTYLAYLRTAISLISFGITINRFSIYLVQAKLLSERNLPRFDLIGVSRVGFGMVIFGLGLLVWAALHASHVSRAIDDGTYRPSPLSAWIITAVVLLGGGLSLIWIFPH